MNRSKYTYLGKNIILFTIKTFAPKLISLLIVPLYTSKLSTADFGTVDLMITTAGLLEVIFTLNIMEAVMRFCLDGRDNKQVLSIAFKIMNIGALILGALIFLVKAGDLFGYSAGMYLFLFAYFYLSITSSALSNYLRGIDRVGDMVIFSLIQSFSYAFFNVLFLLFFDLGLSGYICAALLSQVAAIGFVCVRIRIGRHLVRTGREAKPLQSEMIRYSIPLIFNTLIWWINNSSDRYMVTYFWGASVNGVYSVSYKIPTILSSLNTVIASAWTLSAIKDFDRDDKDGFFSNGYALYNTCMIFGCAALLIVLKPCAALLFANDFYQAWEYSGPLLVSIVFSAFSSYFGSIFVAVKDSKSLAYSTVLSAVVNFGLNLLLIPRFGALGAAAATMISYMVMWFNRLMVSRKYIHMKIHHVQNIIGYAMLIVLVFSNYLDTAKYFMIPASVLVLLIVFWRDLRVLIKRSVGLLQDKLHR